MELTKFGACHVMVTMDAGRHHLSISHKHRYPRWDEIREARYKFMPADIYVVMVLPPKGNYVNVHPNCFHLWETKDPDAAFYWNG